MDSRWWPWRCIKLVICALIFIPSCYSEEAPNYSTFAKDATIAPLEGYYDYIVVGGGTAGCALAATLSQGSNVLLLERGDLPYGNPTVTSINGFAATLANFSPTSASQTFISTDGVYNHRARVLGGGSALNAGFYTRASADFVTKSGWDPTLVKQSYEWVEKKVAFKPPMLEWQSAVRDGLLEAGVLPFNGFTYDHIYGTKLGGTIFDSTGYRHTAADLLEYANPNTIAVHLNAVVHQILFSSEGGPRPKATGVIYTDKNGITHKAYLANGSANEIILSAGTLGSPQLLMLSGIGPAPHLMAHGIKVVLDQPMVGQGLSDNPMNIIAVPTTEPVEVSLIQIVGITEFGSYIEAASAHINLARFGGLGSKLGPILNQTRNANSGPLKPGFDLNIDTGVDLGIILEKVIGPLSTGYLELHSTDPNDNPKVTFNYFQDPRDLARCVQGIEVIIKVLESKAFSKYRSPLLPVQSLIDLVLVLPLNLRARTADAAFSLEQYCIETVMTIWHYHGGSQVDKVVDRDYKVFGVDSLRVIDSSTFLDSPGTNPQATVMMLGRYMGQKILGQRLGKQRK